MLIFSEQGKLCHGHFFPQHILNPFFDQGLLLGRIKIHWLHILYLFGAVAGNGFKVFVPAYIPACFIK